MKMKLKTLACLTACVTMMFGTSLTACAAPVADATPTGVTPNGVIVYDYYVNDLTGAYEAYPAEYLLAIDAAGITNEMTDYEKCVRINNYLCAVLEYGSTGGFEAYKDRALTREEVLASFSAMSSKGIGALKTGKAICSGYTDAFQTMAGMLGMDCYILNGNITQPTGEVESHAWNMVVADGVPYYVDVTWNDCLGNDAYLMSPTGWADHDIASAVVIEGGLLNMTASAF